MSPHPCILAPSILAANHTRLAEGFQIIAEAGLPWVHLDIMDGHFVPNLSFGPQVVADLRPLGKQYFDVHLMLDNPHLYVEAFAKAGAQSITIHTEPDYPIEQTLEHIRALGCEPAICINPHTPAEDLLPYLHHVHMVLLMSVQPGFGGQSFQSNVLDKISQVDLWRKEMSLDLRIEVDGGINIETARLCRERGADTFVAGTAFFKAADKKQFVRDICGQ